jgi:hypothetical protein
MSKIREYVENLSDDEKELIMQGYSKLEEEGVIGDEPIRLHAQDFMRSVGVEGDAYVVYWMEKLDHECCRYFAGQYFRGRRL